VSRGTTRRVATLALVGAVLAAATAAGCGDDDDPAAGIDMVAVRDALDETARDTIATALYENPGSRADLLADVAEEEPELWEEINADGEITLDEFRSVRRVADAVLTYSGEIVDSFEADTVDRADGEG
jgi:hypothetical protein